MRKSLAKNASNLPLLRKLTESKHLKTDLGVLQLEKGNLEARVREWQSIGENHRNFLAHNYLRGSGIEIGAAQLPVKIPATASVKYVDIFSAAELRKAWPQDYSKLDIVEIDVIDDAEKLAKFKDNSLDFIIANHFIEHCLDPIGTVINHYKKLRNEGVLFYGIPDKRFTFDSGRKLTSYKHLLEEHAGKTDKFLKEHTEDFVRLGEKYKGDVAKRAQEIIKSGYRVHYHVWQSQTMLEMFTRLIHGFQLTLEIKAMLAHDNEVIFILQKLS